MKNDSKNWTDHLNFICFPCMSPWGYETINRWNPNAIDPNRSLSPNSSAEECSYFLDAISPFVNTIYAHFDLHETTDTDNTVFRPELEKNCQKISPIPDGFYTVGDVENPCPEFQKAVIDSVRKIAHCPRRSRWKYDRRKKIQQEGVIDYRFEKTMVVCRKHQRQVHDNHRSLPGQPSSQ